MAMINKMTIIRMMTMAAVILTDAVAAYVNDSVAYVDVAVFILWHGVSGRVKTKSV